SSAQTPDVNGLSAAARPSQVSKPFHKSNNACTPQQITLQGSPTMVFCAPGTEITQPKKGEPDALQCLRSRHHSCDSRRSFGSGLCPGGAAASPTPGRGCAPAAPAAAGRRA